MSIAAMTAIELLGITGEQPAHDGGDGSRAGSEEHVGMVGHQGPGITRRRGISQNMTQTLKKVLMVLRIFKYDPALDSPDDNMVQGPGRIYAGLAWHSLIRHEFTELSIFHQRPVCPPSPALGGLRLEMGRLRSDKQGIYYPQGGVGPPRGGEHEDPGRAFHTL